MKTKKLKVEGEEKIKFELKFEFDELTITLFEGGMATKYTDTLTFARYEDTESKLEEELIGETLTRLFSEYKKGKDVEKFLIEKFIDKEHIEFNLTAFTNSPDFR